MLNLGCSTTMAWPQGTTITALNDDFDQTQLNAVLSAAGGDALSKKIDVNPEVDLPITIDIEVGTTSADVDIRCVQVTSHKHDQKATHPETVTVFWGTGEQPFSSVHTFEDFVVMKSATAAEIPMTSGTTAPEGVVHSASFYVGAHEYIDGHEKYRETTQSPLHCWQLAIDRFHLNQDPLGQGLVWRYHIATKTCVLFNSLDSAKFKNESGSDYYSGDVGFRVQGFTSNPTTVSPGKPFSLTLKGALVRETS